MDRTIDEILAGRHHEMELASLGGTLHSLVESRLAVPLSVTLGAERDDADRLCRHRLGTTDKVQDTVATSLNLLRTVWLSVLCTYARCHQGEDA
jgi:hypothetical protein